MRRTTDWITVHHAAALYPQPLGIDDVRAVANYHTKTKGWPGIGYHICLAEETQGGRIARYNVSHLDLQRAHVAWRNDRAIGVSCLTNFTGLPEQKWIDALAEVLAELRQRYPKAAMVGHKEIALGPSQSPDGIDYRTACPGARWAEWKPRLLAQVDRLLKPTTTAARVIGVTPSVTVAQFVAWLQKYRAPLSAVDAEHVYSLAKDLDIDPAFIGAVWQHETSANGAIGASELFKKSNNAGAIRAYGRWPSVEYKGTSWNAYESAQLGLMHLIMHLKQFYGAEGYFDVETIIPRYAPADDGNVVGSYINAVLGSMKEMRL